MTIPSLQVLIMLWFGRRLKTMSSFVDIDPGSAQKERGGGRSLPYFCRNGCHHGFLGPSSKQLLLLLLFT